MLKRLREIRANQDGFTLIELLIVVVILGVLSGIVVFAVSAFNNDGVTAACKADMKNVEIAKRRCSPGPVRTRRARRRWSARATSRRSRRATSTRSRSPAVSSPAP
jgi:prepilin-type N-terminal cleavage/methylation domain-containing protein